MMKTTAINTRLKKVQKATGASLSEISTFFYATLRWVEKHTSVEGTQAINVAINETLQTFGYIE